MNLRIDVSGHGLLYDLREDLRENEWNNDKDVSMIAFLKNGNTFVQ